MYCSALQFGFILCLLFCFQHVSVATPAPGYSTDLRIALNDITNVQDNSIKFLVYTSVVEYPFDTSTFSDDEIAGLAQQAWEEMKQAHQALVDSCQNSRLQQFIQGNRPKMMSAIAVGEQIYFASSIKQNRPNVLLQTPDTVLTRALAQCRTNAFAAAGPVRDEDIHERHGNCGEIMASALHLAEWGDFPWNNDFDDIRVIAFGQTSETIQPPCLGVDQGPFGTQSIGCRNWVDWDKMRAILKGSATPRRVNTAPSRYLNPDLRWSIIPAPNLDPSAAT